jgi:UDPglucose 6-dehydrogenase
MRGEDESSGSLFSYVDLEARVGKDHPLLENVVFCDDAYSCAEGASALVIVTEWEQFRALDFARLKAIMERPVLIDLRNIYRPEEVARHGFVYESVGRARKAIAAS